MATDISIEVAKGLQFKGRVADAERMYRELLGKQSDAVGALEGLGTLLFQQGRAEEAADMFARGLAIEPESVRFHANLGEALRTIRRFDQALHHLRKAVTLAPTEVQAWNSLGLLSHDLQRYPPALHAYREAIRHKPRFVHARINIANTLSAMGQQREAVDELRAALQIEPHNVLALLNLVNILIELRDPNVLGEAETAARHAVSLAPALPLALTTLANVVRFLGRPEEAAELDARARTVDASVRAAPPPAPRDSAAPSARGGERVPPAESPPQAPEAQAQYLQGVANLTEGQFDEAEACLREAIRLDEAMASAWATLAAVQAERGQIDLSCQSARTAIHLQPDLAEAYWRLATNLLGDLPDADVQAMESLARNPALTNDDRALLHFGLATVMDRRKLYEQSAAHVDTANIQQSAGKFTRGLSYDPAQNSELVDLMIATFTPEFIARGAGWGIADTRPVFVVGFPRSGTTLTEQVLASHPQITGAGELPDLNRVFQALPEIVATSACKWFGAIHLLGPETAQAAARRYLEKLDTIAPAGIARVVDKTPDNLNYLGLIAWLLPRAKVIICRRDPRDIAISCWQIGFRTCPWNNDCDRIARRLADYQRMLAHWERVQPLPCLDLCYEEIVADLEMHARRLIDFVGLDWDPACLDFHSNPRAVRTPSLAQVRRPIHSRSAGRWRNYQPFMGPLFEAIERHGVVLPEDN